LSLTRKHNQRAAFEEEFEEEETNRNTIAMQSTPAASAAMRATAGDHDNEARSNQGSTNMDVYYSTICRGTV